jgi:hypothetical protein
MSQDFFRICGFLPKIRKFLLEAGKLTGIAQGIFVSGRMLLE